MPLQFGGTPIGAMQYNGVTIGEAMMDGQVVYRSVITVTPQVPTFLTASPWYTLPTQTGVTYTVSGTPGGGKTVTVTATPQAGYALAGQSSWTHTYDLPVVYITGTSVTVSRDQFRAACTQYGVDYTTVQELPFLLDTSQATDLSQMFVDCSALTTVSNLDTSQATTMSYMFSNCSALTTVPNLNTSQATNLSYMFQNCSSLTTAPNLDTSQATNLRGIFRGCSALTTVPNLDTSRATDLAYMFYGCSVPTTVPNLNTSQATNVSYMFGGCTSLTTVPNLDTSKATNVFSMFRDCSALTTVPDLNTSQATAMSYMFYGCSALTTVPDLETSKATSLGYMFWGCSSLTDGNVRLIGKPPSADTTSMITGSGLTREPFQGAEGTITGRTLTNNTLTTLETHTLTAQYGGGLKYLRMTLAWGNATATKSIRIDRNGVQVATATGQNPVATVEVACNVGDVITYKATVNSTTTANRIITSGTWGAWTR